MKRMIGVILLLTMTVSLVGCMEKKRVADAEIPAFLDGIGKTYAQLREEYPDAVITSDNGGLPDAAAIYFGNPDEEYQHLIFATQYAPFDEISEATKNQLQCAGYLTSVEVLFPQAANRSVEEFFAAIGVADYTSELEIYEEWLMFEYRGWTVDLNTAADSRDANGNFVGIELVKGNYPVTMYDSAILSANIDLVDENEIFE